SSRFFQQRGTVRGGRAGPFRLGGKSGGEGRLRFRDARLCRVADDFLLVGRVKRWQPFRRGNRLVVDNERVAPAKFLPLLSNGRGHFLALAGDRKVSRGFVSKPDLPVAADVRRRRLGTCRSEPPHV